ncbi:uncharacterized protein DS421_16g529650 [Arachis hypogaea]|uniref:Uncharacterized protein n=1 Tax=Arachis hypogaea TaxID=3818 RepID=A0A444YHS5_ARAHY|nr:uncharacterized protein DS421_16g529650 [Arachis hypogaea]RYR01458.1 hypothetical protein Ahy_B06g080324 [Arachis hypogaea]
MAGLQQYNFFPTDLFYPKPSSPAVAKPTVLPLQTPTGGDITANAEDHHNQQQQPRSLVKATPSTTTLLLHHNNNNKQQQQQQQQPILVDNKFKNTPLSWMDWIDQEEGSEGF